jgi:hypothetical protein
MATKKTDTIAGKRFQLGHDHSVTIEAVRGRKVTIVGQAVRATQELLEGR